MNSLQSTSLTLLTAALASGLSAQAAQDAKAQIQAGITALKAGDGKQAEQTFEALCADAPKNGRYRFMLAMARLQTKKPKQAWSDLLLANRLAPNQKPIHNQLTHMWNRFDRTGVFNVGTPSTQVRAMLGEPQNASQRGSAEELTYGFFRVRCMHGRIHNVVDARNAKLHQLAAAETLVFPLRGWAAGHRLVNQSAVTTEYVRPGERVQAWSELLSTQRLRGAASRGFTPRKVMENMRANLRKRIPSVRWTVLKEDETSILYTFGTDKESEIARLVIGKRDIWRLAFAKKVANLGAPLTKQWSECLQAAHLLPRSTTSKPVVSASSASHRQAWELGSKLSLAGILHANGADSKLVQRQMTLAQLCGQGLGVAVPKLPAIEPKTKAGRVSMMQFLMKAGGADLADQVQRKTTQRHKRLFEMALKSNMTLMIYSPGDAAGQNIAASAEKASSQVGLPETLWRPAVEAIRKNAPYDQVKTAILTMHRKVSNHLRGGAALGE